MLLGVVLQVEPKVVGEGVFALLFLFLVVEKSSFVPLQKRFTSVGTLQDVLNYYQSSFACLKPVAAEKTGYCFQLPCWVPV